MRSQEAVHTKEKGKPPHRYANLPATECLVRVVFCPIPSESGCWRRSWTVSGLPTPRPSLPACRSAPGPRCSRTSWPIWPTTRKPDKSPNRTEGVRGDPSVRILACYEWQLVAVCDSMCRIVCTWKLSLSLSPFSFFSLLLSLYCKRHTHAHRLAHSLSHRLRLPHTKLHTYVTVTYTHNYIAIPCSWSLSHTRTHTHTLTPSFVMVQISVPFALLTLFGFCVFQ